MQYLSEKMRFCGSTLCQVVQKLEFKIACPTYTSR